MPSSLIEYLKLNINIQGIRRQDRASETVTDESTTRESRSHELNVILPLFSRTLLHLEDFIGLALQRSKYTDLGIIMGIIVMPQFHGLCVLWEG
jgi:hypothetical protein